MAPNVAQEASKMMSKMWHEHGKPILVKKLQFLEPQNDFEEPVSERNGKRAQLKSFLSDLEKHIGDCQTLACSLASFARIVLVGSHCKTWPAPLYLPEQVCSTRSILSLARSTLAKSYRPCNFALARLMRKNTGMSNNKRRCAK